MVIQYFIYYLETIFNMVYLDISLYMDFNILHVLWCIPSGGASRKVKVSGIVDFISMFSIDFNGVRAWPKGSLFVGYCCQLATRHRFAHFPCHWAPIGWHGPVGMRNILCWTRDLDTKVQRFVQVSNYVDLLFKSMGYFVVYQCNSLSNLGWI